MNKQEIVQKFSHQVSWFDSLHPVNVNGNDGLTDGKLFFFPVDWRDAIALFDDLNIDDVTLVIGGEPTKQEATELTYRLIQKGVGVMFVDAAARVAHSQFITKSLDGVDWSRTFLQAIQDPDAAPIYEWD